MPESKQPSRSGSGSQDGLPSPAPVPSPAASQAPVYRAAARHMHWLTVAFVAGMVPVGLFMTSRAERNIWDGLTNGLYSGHKLAGVVLLMLVIARLVYRLVRGAPADEPTLEPWQKFAAHVTHWTLYALLLIVPILGWIGVSLYPALDIFGLFKLPGLVSPDQPASSNVFLLHKLGAFALVGLIALHIGAGLFHHFIRKDGVLRRMLPGLKTRGE